MNIPNYAQAARISNDIRTLMNMPTRERGDVYYQCDRNGIYVAHVGDNDEMI